MNTFMAENMISVGHCVIPPGNGLVPQLFGCDFKPRSILATQAFDLFGIKRSWHSTERGSKIVGVERVSVTKQITSMHRVNGNKIKVEKEKCNLKRCSKDKKGPEYVTMRKETVDLSIRSWLCST